MKDSIVSDEVADIAITWFVRLRAEDLEVTEHKAFLGWLLEDRMHQQAFIETITLWEDVSVIKQMDALHRFPLVLALIHDHAANVANNTHSQPRHRY